MKVLECKAQKGGSGKNLIFVYGNLCIEGAAESGDGDKSVARFGIIGLTGKLACVIAEVFEKAFEFTLHRVHLFPHVKDDLDTGKVHAEVAGERKYDLKTLDVAVF